MLVTCEEMKRIEAAAFTNGADARDLMEQAGLGMAREIARFFPVPARVLAVCGKGNNAGDVLVAARHLRNAGWSASELLVFPDSDLSPLAAAQLERFRDTPTLTDSRLADRRLVVLDGLLGIGTDGAPREPIAAAIRQIATLRNANGAFVVAADIPSGLDGDSGIAATPCVTADLTVTIGQPKTGLVADSATAHVGRLAFIPLEKLSITSGNTAGLITPELLRPLLRPPAFESHKGTWGRVGVVAGSRGFLGAARLCATGALRAGGGLVTLYALPEVYDLLAATCPPEVMVKPVPCIADALSDPLDALALGPGTGASHDDDILSLAAHAKCPAVIDADALNALARHENWPAFSAARLLTPHPGEMLRLFPESRLLSRRETAERFTHRHPVTLLLKGSRSIIAEAGKPTLFNTTGNPGMGSGGMGDVLTGVAAALLARHFSTHDAALLAAWICGRAAEHRVFGPGGSPESLVASDIPGNLGAAFAELSLCACASPGEARAGGA